MIKVTDEQLLGTFNALWMKSWMEKGYDLEFAKNSDKYLLEHNREYVGTAEFKRYIDSNVNDFFDFEKIEYIRKNKEKTFEIDKVSIGNKGRIKVLNELLTFLANYAMENEMKYAIALIEPRFGEILDKAYHLPIAQVGDRMHYKGDDVLPIVIDIKKFTANLHQYKWYKGVVVYA